MLDPKRIRSEPDALAKRLRVKKFDLDVRKLTQLEEQRKILQLETEELQNKRNSKSKQIGIAKKSSMDITEVLVEMEVVKKELEAKKVIKRPKDLSPYDKIPKRY